MSESSGVRVGGVAVGWKGIERGVLAAAGVERQGGLVRVPYRGSDGAAVFTKVFSDAGASWYEPRGIDLIPFGLETLPRSSWIARRTALLVCEGESDALCARQYFGYSAADW